MIERDADPGGSGRVVLLGGIVALFALGVAHLARSGAHIHEPARLAFEATISFGSPLVMFAVSHRVLDFSHSDYWALVKWAVAGLGAFVFIAAMYVLDLHLEDATILHPSFLFVLAADLGAVFGLFAGVQNVRNRQSIRRAERAEARAEITQKHRDRLVFLNRILRHHVLNGMSVVLGYTSRLRKDARADQEELLDVIEEQGKQTVDYVSDMRGLIRSLTGEVTTAEIDISEVIASEVDAARSTHPDAEFVVDVPSGVTVLGTPLVPHLFENLFENAVKHNDAETPEVAVTVTREDSSAHVVVADNGPGIPDPQKQAYFGRGEHGADSQGEGLGLYFVETIVSECGGSVRIEDAEPRGTEVHLEFPDMKSVDDVAEKTPEHSV